jgi:hypothetical protein
MLLAHMLKHQPLEAAGVLERIHPSKRTVLRNYPRALRRPPACRGPIASNAAFCSSVNDP